MLNSLNKRIVLLFVLTTLVLGSLFAGFSYSPSLQLYAGGAFTYPTDDYLKISQGKELPAVRTSADFGADIMAINLKLNKFSWGTGFAVLYNTRSLAAGIQFLRPYFGIGVTTGFKYHFASPFSLGFKFRYLFCSYKPFKNRFDIIETEIAPAYDLFVNRRLDTTVYVPVAFTYKSDSVSMRVGVGFDIQVNFYFGGKNDKE